MPHRTIRRNTLRTAARKCRLWLRCSQRLTDDYAFDNATDFGRTSWRRARYCETHEQAQTARAEGFAVIDDDMLRSKSGGCWETTDAAGAPEIVLSHAGTYWRVWIGTDPDDTPPPIAADTAADNHDAARKVDAVAHAVGLGDDGPDPAAGDGSVEARAMVGASLDALEEAAADDAETEDRRILLGLAARVLRDADHLGEPVARLAGLLLAGSSEAESGPTGGGDAVDDALDAVRGSPELRAKAANRTRMVNLERAIWSPTDPSLRQMLQAARSGLGVLPPLIVADLCSYALTRSADRLGIERADL